MKKWFMKYYHEIVSSHSSPKSIASGVAVGSFIAIFPTPGFGILLGVLVAFLFPRINKFSIFITMAVFNPLILTPIYALNYKLGDRILGGTKIVSLDFNFGASLYELTIRLILGSLITGIIISSLLYLIVYLLVRNKQKKNGRKRNKEKTL